MIVSGIALLFAPGYWIVRARLPTIRHNAEIIVLSILFSCAVLPVLVFYGSRVGVPITGSVVIAWAAIVIGLCYAVSGSRA